MSQFYSHGKLLIAGEYLVLKGATSLAVPVNFGQSLIVENADSSDNLIWRSFEKDNLWFSVTFKTSSLEIIETSDDKIAEKLLELLKYTAELNPGFVSQIIGKQITTTANFDLNWGLGSSSSLISNIAYWADIDPFELHKRTSQGSGFDIVAARADGPIFFKLKDLGYEVKDTTFNPEFKDKIFFIYLGNKQDSSISVEQFKKKRRKLNTEIQLISDLSKHIATSKRIDDFEYYLKEHELILSSVLKRKTIKEERFKDLVGEIKSLGAWGGDFAMLTWHGSESKLDKYLQNKKIQTAFSFEKMVKIR